MEHGNKSDMPNQYIYLRILDVKQDHQLESDNDIRWTKQTVQNAPLSNIMLQYKIPAQRYLSSEKGSSLLVIVVPSGISPVTPSSSLVYPLPLDRIPACMVGP